MIDETTVPKKVKSWSKRYMKKVIGGLLVILICQISYSQKPCSTSPEFRQFDFWIGQWEAFATNGRKAGDSKISLILDSCIILEEWISASIVSGLRYSGKSFNAWKKAQRQWQQTWVDNTGGTIAYTQGKFENDKIIFNTDPFMVAKDTIATRRLTFFNLGPDKVRQLGEITKDKGVTWNTEYDLEYRRKK